MDEIDKKVDRVYDTLINKNTATLENGLFIRIKEVEKENIKRNTKYNNQIKKEIKEILLIKNNEDISGFLLSSFRDDIYSTPLAK